MKVCLQLPATPRWAASLFSSVFLLPGLAGSPILWKKSPPLIKRSTLLPGSASVEGCLGYPGRLRALGSNYRKSTLELPSYLHTNNSGLAFMSPFGLARGLPEEFLIQSEGALKGCLRSDQKDLNLN